MKLRTGNMWWAWDRTDLFLIATNSDIRYDGALTMEHGIAKEAAKRFPELPRSLGAAIKHFSENDNGRNKYGILIPEIWSPAPKVGAFQTKHECQDQAQLNLIWYSTNQLLEWCARYPEARVDLEFPGIDDLTPDQVLPIINKLPDTVTVWQKKEPTSFMTNAVWDNINAAIDKIPEKENQDDFINELIDNLNQLYQNRHKHEELPIDF